jgi:hypothetical protein
MAPQTIEDRQDEGGGLARAGLRGGEDVPTLEYERDGRPLDGRRGVVPLLGDHSHEIGRQAE